MKITVNGRQEEVRENITLMEFIDKKGLEPGSLIIEHNRQVVRQDALSDTMIKESDMIEVLRLVGGG